MITEIGNGYGNNCLSVLTIPRQPRIPQSSKGEPDIYRTLREHCRDAARRLKAVYEGERWGGGRKASA